MVVQGECIIEIYAYSVGLVAECNFLRQSWVGMGREFT